MQALIISGGTIEDTFALDFIEDFSQRHRCHILIAVDSGMNFCHRNNLIPDYIVGDFDSVEVRVLENFQEMAEHFLKETGYRKPKVLNFQPEKDETDTELAVQTAIKLGCTKINLLGGTGTRIDHMLGNLHLCGMAMEQGVECRLLDGSNRIRVLDRSTVIKKKDQYGDFVSLIPFTPSVTGLTLKGFKYPLTDFELKCYHSIGISNEILEEEGAVCFESGILIVIESRD